MAINKVVYNGKTLVDLTNDSVDDSVLMEGETAHDKTGKTIVGNRKPYVLPQMTESVLGGAKAVPATDEMTQAVGIDTEGKLVTKPAIFIIHMNSSGAITETYDQIKREYDNGKILLLVKDLAEGEKQIYTLSSVNTNFFEFVYFIPSKKNNPSNDSGGSMTYVAEFQIDIYQITSAFTNHKIRQLLVDKELNQDSNQPVSNKVITEKFNSIEKSKVSLPMNGITPNKGNVGDFAVSDGNGGITWQELVDRTEVGA